MSINLYNKNFKVFDRRIALPTAHFKPWYFGGSFTFEESSAAVEKWKLISMLRECWSKHHSASLPPALHSQHVLKLQPFAPSVVLYYYTTRYWSPKSSKRYNQYTDKATTQWHPYTSPLPTPPTTSCTSTINFPTEQLSATGVATEYNG